MLGKAARPPARSLLIAANLEVPRPDADRAEEGERVIGTKATRQLAAFDRLRRSSEVGVRPDIACRVQVLLSMCAEALECVPVK